MVLEEMSGAGNDYQPHLCLVCDLRSQLPHALDVAKLIALTVNQKQRLPTRLQKLEVVLVERRADADQVTNACIRNPDFQTDERAERKAAQRDAQVGVIGSEIVECDANVVALAASFVVFARTLAHAAEVDTDRKSTRLNSSQ